VATILLNFLRIHRPNFMQFKW